MQEFACLLLPQRKSNRNVNPKLNRQVVFVIVTLIDASLVLVSLCFNNYICFLSWQYTMALFFWMQTDLFPCAQLSFSSKRVDSQCLYNSCYNTGTCFSHILLSLHITTQTPKHTLTHTHTHTNTHTHIFYLLPLPSL